jgi:hypothetical protein
MAQAELTLPRKMSSILGQNCPEFRVATFPIQVTDISCPLLSPSLHTSLLTSFPPLLCLFLPPLFIPLVQGEVVPHFAFTPKTVRFNPQPRKVRYIAKCSVVFVCVCVFLCNIYSILVPFCRYVQISRYRFCACMYIYVRKQCLVRRETELRSIATVGPTVDVTYL